MKETVWIYPGSFDPLTLGHLDIIKRASRMCTRLLVAILDNPQKCPLFSIDERVKMSEEAVANLANVSVMRFSGLQVELYRECHADAVVRGVRSLADYEYELTEIRTNQMLLPGFEAVILLNDKKYTFVSSSTVRILAMHGGDLSDFVPPFIEEMVKDKFKEIYYGEQN